MKISIVGTGYVGLVTGSCLSNLGHKIYAVDKRENIVNKINKGYSHIYEPGLEPILKKNISNGNFTASLDLISSLNNSDYVFICVGTPTIKDNIDLSQIESVSKEIGNYLALNKNKFLHIIIKSTVVPTTTDRLVNDIILSQGVNKKQFTLAMIPEFLREGSAVNDFISADRIVIGCDLKYKKNYKSIFSPLGNIDFIYTNTRTAEMIKYANNSILASQISLINELSNYSEKIGLIDFSKVLNGVELDNRWSPVINKKRIRPDILDYLKPGPGFGGSCFPKDVKAIVASGKKNGLNMNILSNVISVNKFQPINVVNRVVNFSKKNNIKKVSILILGLAFKSNTDDVRESPSASVINEFVKKGFDVSAHDPIAISNFKKFYNCRINYLKHYKEKINQFNVIILMTSWQEYLELNYDKLINKKEKVLFYDTRNLIKNSKILLKNVYVYKPGINY